MTNEQIINEKIKIHQVIGSNVVNKLNFESASPSGDKIVIKLSVFIIELNLTHWVLFGLKTQSPGMTSVI